MTSLSNQQRLFCQEYLKLGMNGTHAYLSVYKTCKKEETARVNASRLLTNANIQEYIKDLQGKLEDETIMNVKERMKWLSKVINGEIKEKVPMITTDKDGNTKTIEQEVPSKLKVKIEALDILNKMDNSYKQTIEVRNPQATKVLESINKQLGGKSD